ncbi:hypothetical protein TSAR_000144 [Trichomalopsis sarcophagae]|uniref:Uncharacterized protein n=1 Tax=Trichomalopsis sarcophagae TaxID=543379 RepID=A0A232FBU4_9HYME|nr:hypothetical protein TSAR_000144 [Trichomalopsis sarcophagae]
MTDQLLKMEKLNAENYPAWCFRMKSYLVIEGLWDVIEKMPPADEDDEWIRKDEITRAKINLMVDDSQIPYIIEAKSAREAWMSLRVQHHKFNSILLTFRSMCRLRMSEDDDVNKHLASYSRYICQLHILGFTLPDIVITANLMASLPNSYVDLILDVDNKINVEGINIPYKQVFEMVRAWKKPPTKQNHDAVNISLSDTSLGDVAKLVSSPKSPRHLRNKC